MLTVNITLKIDEIIYDIQNKTYLTGKSRHDGKNHEQVANMQANDDEENANQILRSISSAFNNLKTKLSEYVESTSLTADNTLITRDTPLIITLRMPSNYNNATASTISSAAHQYIVSSAVAEWFAITYKADSPQYVAMADICLDIISDAINRRRRPSRTTADDSSESSLS